MAQSSEEGKNAVPKQGSGLKSLFKLNRDRQISPSPDSNTAETRLEITTKSKEDKRIERDDKRTRREEVQRIKNMEMQSKIAKRSFRKDVKQDLAKTSCETFVTFCFIVTVGTVLFGGGTALIVSGRENNIVDFIVVGSSGIVIGIIFSSAGIVLIFKPVYENYQIRKKESQDGINQNRTFLTSQISDEGQRSRRPSNAELYGDTPSAHPASSVPEIVLTPVDPRRKTDPPPLAIPNIVEKNAKNEPQIEPVFYMDTKEHPEETSKSTVEAVAASSNHSLPQTNPDLTKDYKTIPDIDHHLESGEGQQDVQLLASGEMAHFPDASLESERSESPVVVIHNKMRNVNDTTTTESDIEETKHNRSTPTIILDDSLSRDHSSHTIRSKAQTPSSVMLTYDKYTFDEVNS